MWIYKKNYNSVNKEFLNNLIEQNEDHLVYIKNEEESNIERILNN